MSLRILQKCLKFVRSVILNLALNQVQGLTISGSHQKGQNEILNQVQHDTFCFLQMLETNSQTLSC